MAASDDRAATDTPADDGGGLIGADYSQPERECDMVMKGGITSGVVYPLAVCELARRYRLRNIGGASAGAIAACAAAAAERGRDSGGYGRLAALPGRLAVRLPRLFQPSPSTRPAFAVLMAGIDSTRTGRRKVIGVIGAIVRARPAGAVVGLLVVVVPAAVAGLAADGLPRDGADWAALARLLAVVAVVPGCIAVVLGALVALVLATVRALPASGYGLCRGSRGAAAVPDDPDPPLTDWLTTVLDDLAGVGDGDAVLTFGDLWGPGVTASSPRPDRRVHLEVMTTNVTHGRPARIPFEERTWMCCVEELAELFPPRVIDQLRRAGAPAARRTDGMPWRCPIHGTQLLDLPPPEDLPVVVAARMSLSFPGLISAVPLYAVDYSRASVDDQLPVRCWFSDGGISSNFPIHFFDAMWPSRPTFGISLAPYHPDHPDDDTYYPGPAEHGRRPRVRGTETAFGFFAAILDTMQNWSDEGQSALPGYRDRIVEIHHTDREGGLNLSMDPATVKRLAHRGKQAATDLATFDFPQHRWTRYLSAMSEIEQMLRHMNRWYRSPLPDGSPTYEDLVRDYGPTPHLYPHARAWLEVAMRRTADLMELAVEEPAEPSRRFSHEAPRPDPDLRITPHF